MIKLININYLLGHSNFTLAVGDCRYGRGQILLLAPYGVDGYKIVDQFTDGGDGHDHVANLYIDTPWFPMVSEYAGDLLEGLVKLETMLVDLAATEEFYWDEWGIAVSNLCESVSVVKAKHNSTYPEEVVLKTLKDKLQTYKPISNLYPIENIVWIGVE